MMKQVFNVDIQLMVMESLNQMLKALKMQNFILMMNINLNSLMK